MAPGNRLTDLVNKNTGCPFGFEFQVTFKSDL